MAASFSFRQRVMPDLAAAGICALVTLAYAGSFAQLMFGGVLDPFTPLALVAAIVSSAVATLVLSLRSSFVFALGGPDSNPSAVLAVTLAAITHEIVREAGTINTPELLPTVFMFLSVSAGGCGLIVYLLGERRWGRYIRYIPHPVMAGFLAGTGYLLIAGAWKMLTGTPFHVGGVALLRTVHPLSAVTAVGVATALLVLTRSRKHYLIIPAVLFSAMGLFHLACLLYGYDLEAARGLGLLMAPLQPGDWNSPFTLPVAEVRWDLVLFHAKDFAAMTMVVVITTLLNTNSVELATGIEGDADRELKAVGLSNILSGLLGGMVAVNSLNRSVLNLRAGARSRWAARLSALGVVAVMVFAPELPGLVPKPVLTGLILFLGLNLVSQWLIDARQTMPWSDYAVVLAIVGIVVVLGMVAGVMLGLVIACVSFVFTLSQSPTVRHEFTARNRRSNVERSIGQQQRLQERGEALRGFSLQGFMFFGTASTVLDLVRSRRATARLVVLDFRLVHGVDGSATVVLRKLRTLCAEEGIVLVLCGLSPAVASVLQASEIVVARREVEIFPDLDYALEWSENALLADDAAMSSLAAGLAGVLDENEVEVLHTHFERMQISAGEALVRQGEASRTMFLLETGRVSVSLRLPGSGTGASRSKRLRSYGPGTIVGEMGFYSGEARSADIMAVEDTVALAVSAERLAELERTHPVIASKLHRHVVQTLSHRLRSANAEISGLL